MIRLELQGGDGAVLPLPHGVDPVRELLRRGWAGRPVSATVTGEDLVLGYDVWRATPADIDAVLAQRDPEEPLDPDPDLTPAELAGAVLRQRVAAYAVVVTHRGLLLTELSERTNAAGLWNLPGGGLDPGEQLSAGLVREVAEETGQRVTSARLVTVVTRRWVGRSPAGVVENYQAVRLFHTAHCPDPTDPVVHDVGGSTSAAAWVRTSSVDVSLLASGVLEGLAAAGVTVGATR